MNKDLLFLLVIPAGWLARVWVLRMKALLAEMHEVAQSPHLYEFDVPAASGSGTADTKATPSQEPGPLSMSSAPIHAFEHRRAVQ